MPIFECPYPDCTYATQDVKDELAIVMFNMHAAGAHNSQNNRPAKAEAVKRPTVSIGGTSEEWQYFLTRWADYKTATKISGVDLIIQLLECCAEDLRKDLTRSAGGSLTGQTEEVVLKKIKALAVRQENIMVARVELHNMHQDIDESIRSFSARVKGQADVCRYILSCPSCSYDVSYTEEIMKDIIVKGVSDNEIQLDILSNGNQNMTLEDILRLVEAKEAGKRSASKIMNNVQGTCSSSSAYKRSQKTKLTNEQKCGYCGKSGHGKNAPVGLRRKQCQAFGKDCSYCGLANHFALMCRMKAHGLTKVKSSSIEKECETTSECPIWQELCSIRNNNNTNYDENRRQVNISHHIYDSSTEMWVKKPSKPQPSIMLSASTQAVDYQKLGFELLSKPTSIKISVIPDTGCQSCLAGLKFFDMLGISKSQLIPVRIQMAAANRSKINILGAAIVNFSGKNPNGDTVQTKQMVYATDATNRVYISEEACAQLGMLPTKFPLIGATSGIVVTAAQMNLSRDTDKQDISDCGCPKRQLPPAKPTKLPFQVKSSSDVIRLKDWLIDYYKSSTFNVCTHQTLPYMKGPPLRLTIDPAAESDPQHNPLVVPLHWRESVKAGLDQDVRLGVIRPVPVGEPTTWCHQMVVCAKQNGKLRRTVDFQALNKYASRETHHTQAPYKQARSVPAGKLKTVFDCWNGYHSIPLHPDDIHYTTFITPWGRYQYLVAPQGYIASGDGFSRRFDEIVSEVPNKTKCVDDTLLWSDSVEEAFAQAVDWLELCGKHGIILNPDKFTFAQETVNFAGFCITKDAVRPSVKYLRAIKEFPTPNNLTDIRSWFGVVNQVSYAFASADVMNPFRDLLKSNAKFQWDDEMEKIFQQSKLAIVNQIENGVKIFDKSRPTCLATDWSRTGIGYWLLQKYCDCDPIRPFCCHSGWQVTLVGSRFTHTAESRYAPVEGEALAVAYALDHARYFVLGCKDLVIATDHKPLIKVFEDRSLDIPNNRLRNLKEKTLRYRFKMVYVPGRKHKATDAVSRKPAGTINPPKLMLPDDIAHEVHQQSLSSEDGIGKNNVHDSPQIGILTSFLSSLCVERHSGKLIPQTANALNTIQAVNWEKVQVATSSDTDMEHLLSIVENGFPHCKNELPSQLQSYFQFRDKLSSSGGVVLYKNRIVIPPSLRPDVLSLLHCAHQGVTRMIARAEMSVFWPGITSDIHQVRSRCLACNKMTPSQPQAPPTDISYPKYPFQMLCADFFTYRGKNYLVVVDRYSNWPIIERATNGSTGLIECLRRTFSTFGVPDELTSDGGLEFTSRLTQKFLQDWGVRHRRTSVAFPHANCRAEIGVKTAKRMISDNTDDDGNLNIDAFQRAILTYRNTPDPETRLSPACCIFGRPIKDLIPIHRDCYNPHPTWVDVLNKREDALRNRHQRLHNIWSERSRVLPPLRVGDYVRVQNQVGPMPRRWEKTGIVTEVRQFDQYLIKMDGSNRVSLRNRRFLRKYLPMIPHDRTSQLRENVRIVKSSAPSPIPVVERMSSSPDPASGANPDENIYSHDQPDVGTDTDTLTLNPEPGRSSGNVRHRRSWTKSGKPKLAVRRLGDFNAKGLKELD